MRGQAGDMPEKGEEHRVDTIHRLDRMVSRVLAVGLVIAVVLMLTGAVLALVGRGPSPPSELSVSDLPRALEAVESEAFLTMGLLALLVTPIARVLALVVGFARAKSRIFCYMGVMVLVVLALSAYLGLVG